MGVYDIAINWSTAEVTAGRNDLHLKAELTPEPDTFWTNEFSRLCERRSAETRGGRWSANTPSYGKLTVSGVEAGSEESLRKALDEIVAQTNREAARAHREDDEKKRREEDEGRAREQVAREMTDRLRSSGE